MKKIVFSLFISFVCLSLFATGAQESDGAKLSGSVSTNGSTSMQKVIMMLIEDFSTKAPGVKVTYDPTGSGTGVASAATGKADIGLASRALKEGEIAQGLEGTTLAFDGIAMVVHKDNKVDSITMAQLADIFTGKITNWKELGGEDLNISCIGREAGSGTRSAFDEITKTSGKQKLDSELVSTGAVIAAVANNKNGIGYASLSAVEGQTGVKALKIDGVAPSETTVKNSSYKLQRPFVLVTKKGSKLSDVAQAFFDYITSGRPEVNELIIKAGVVPAK